MNIETKEVLDAAEVSGIFTFSARTCRRSLYRRIHIILPLNQKILVIILR